MNERYNSVLPIDDPEYQRYIKEVAAEASALGIRSAWIALVIVALVLGAVIFALHAYQAPTGLMIPVTISASTLCLIFVFWAGVIRIDGRLAVLSQGTEWFEAKLLREFESKRSREIVD